MTLFKINGKMLEDKTIRMVEDCRYTKVSP